MSFRCPSDLLPISKMSLSVRTTVWHPSTTKCQMTVQLLSNSNPLIALFPLEACGIHIYKRRAAPSTRCTDRFLLCGRKMMCSWVCHHLPHRRVVNLASLILLQASRHTRCEHFPRGSTCFFRGDHTRWHASAFTRT